MSHPKGLKPERFMTRSIIRVRPQENWAVVRGNTWQVRNFSLMEEIQPIRSSMISIYTGPNDLTRFSIVDPCKFGANKVGQLGAPYLERKQRSEF